MVRLIFIIIFVHNFVACMGQKTTFENKISLGVSFNKDNVFMGDSLEITISYKNNSEDTLKFYSEGRVTIHHSHPEVFITYETTERIAYILREYSNRNSIVWLKPGEEIQEIFNITAKESFFYIGENIVNVFYRNIWDNPVEHKKQKKQKKTKQASTIVLCSAPIKIMINTIKDDPLFGIDSLSAPD